ncbi:hypothetical protein [Nonomuraea rhizosphaerae]|uniref:hypothetical protein n=1 Tax=Nonomuraea rhizosphaerae TaxID=2665663 RepID=UPI001C5FDA79|nr:hypothetical protein [Nonomuraea rhizosphaerae]
MADLRNVIEKLLRRPAFWRPDPPLPTILVTGPLAPEAIKLLAEPFKESVPYALVEDGDHESVQALVEGLAERLGKRVDGALLPPPRFPLAQFVLWARQQLDARPDHWPEVWPPDPHKSPRGFKLFNERLKEWRRTRRGGDHGRKTSADFLARAATTWVPVGTLAVWWAGGAADLVGVLPWVVGGAVALAGTLGQGLLSIKGSLFIGWLRRQPYVPRRRFESTAKYALRLAGAEQEEIEQLLVHTLVRDLSEAYRKWIIPWPSWGRGLYPLLLVQVGSSETNARFLRLLDETTKQTGLLPPMVVLAAVPHVPDGARTGAEDLGELGGSVEAWRSAAGRRVPDLRIHAHADALPEVGDRQLLPRRRRAVGYWTAIGLLLVLPFAWVVWMQLDRNAHCGGLSWAERTGAECVGIVNADRATPGELFAGEVKELVKKIDANNAYAISSGRYVSLVLFGEFSIKRTEENDTRLAAAVSELAAVEEYQRTVASTPRLRVLIANAGDNFAHGRRTAQLITELSGQDPHVMGVAGLQRSVLGVSEAILELHLAKIPMVSSTATADGLGYIANPAKPRDIGDPSPYYFHVGPTNFREAALGARFAKQTLLAGVAEPTAVIVQDGSHTDQYTNNLADDFDLLLTEQGVKVMDRVAYTIEAGGISSSAVKACALKPHVVIYAGRSSEFRDFLAAIEGKACGEVKVIAGDDVVKAVTDFGAEIANMKQVEVYYMALAHRDLWTGEQVKPTAFVSRLLGKAHATASDDNLILTYDAANVIYQAANHAYRAPGADEASGLPSKGDILYRLSRTAGEDAWEGSSGVIDFSAAELHAPVNKALAIMKVDGSEPDHTRPVVRCGILDANEAPSKDKRCAGLPDVAPHGARAAR